MYTKNNVICHIFLAINMLIHSSVYPIAGSPHKQFITTEQPFISRLLKPKGDTLQLAQPIERPTIRKARTGRRIPRPIKQKNKTLSKMEYEELEEVKNKHLASGNKEIAIKYLEQMIKLCDNIDRLALHLVEFADLLFNDSHFEKAGRIYTEFTTLYPGNKQAEYTLYRAILCSFYQTLDAERDQTKTEETIQLADTFLERGDIFLQYKGKVEKLRDECYQKLIASEINVFTFYLKKESFQSAQKRLDSLRTDWLPKMPVIESQLIMLEIALAEKKRDPKMVTTKQNELQKKYPHETITLAKNRPKKNMITRF